MSNLIFGNGFIGNILNKEFDGYEISDLNPLFYNVLCEALDTHKPEVVINCIGKTGRPNIDWCEENKEDTILSNTIVPSILSVECSRRGIYFVHIGSGCIYSNRDGDDYFTENDEPNFYGPQFYAKSKILAEKVISNFSPLQIRIRMPIVAYPHERNLITKLSKYDRVIDIPNSMTIIDDFIPVVKSLIEERATGIFNVVNEGVISAYEIMKLYSEIVDNSYRISILSREDLNRITTGERSNCHLLTDRIKQYGLSMPNIRDSIRDVLYKYKKNL